MTKRHTALTIEDPTPGLSEIGTTDTLEERIRQRAYELYEQRGKQDGFAEQDWLQAEAEILTSNALKAVA